MGITVFSEIVWRWLPHLRGMMPSAALPSNIHMRVNICWAFIIILGTLCARNPTACRQRCPWLLQLPSVMPGGLSGAPAATNWRPPLWDEYLQFISCQLIPLQKSWDDARTYCVCTESADLVDIQSAAEDGFLQVLTGGTAAIWIGRK